MNEQGERFTMKRLKHPIRAVREPFGTAGLVVAIIALILAMTGAAFAAAGLSGKQKKEVETIAKKFAGKPGKQGSAGPQGPAGSVGAKGDAGAPGATGAAGAAGSPGKQGLRGESAPCTESELECTLPSGVTETGTWAMTVTDPLNAEVFVKPFTSISFPIPLESPGEANSAFAFNKEKTEKEEFGTSGCTGTAAEPTAPLGKLCVYTFFEEAVNTNGSPYELEGLEPSTGHRYGVSGSILSGPRLEPETGSASIEAFGSWAVTAP